MANVLIVDDNVESVEASTLLLESAGHQIRTGYNGEEGLKSLGAGPLPDCVLLDVDMPVLSGPQMVHRMLMHDAGEERIPPARVGKRRPVRAGRAHGNTVLPRQSEPWLWGGSAHDDQ
jgi:CheY-like chemotaxis protein